MGSDERETVCQTFWHTVNEASSEGGVSSISHTDSAAPAISLQSRGDAVFSECKDNSNANGKQGKGGKILVPSTALSFKRLWLFPKFIKPEELLSTQVLVCVIADTCIGHHKYLRCPMQLTALFTAGVEISKKECGITSIKNIIEVKRNEKVK